MEGEREREASRAAEQKSTRHEEGSSASREERQKEIPPE
jgi:hypothetical protein